MKRALLLISIAALGCGEEHRPPLPIEVIPGVYSVTAYKDGAEASVKIICGDAGGEMVRIRSNGFNEDDWLIRCGNAGRGTKE